ncbi:MAG: NAD-binding protein, partial [Clostridia bacterium]|nr:NAD-binding protein [Clostridia bacterium]
MKIVIIGCGKIGVTLIESFLKEGHEVTAVDSDSSVITDIANSYDVRTICGNGTDYELLTEAGISSTDLIVATTDSDELNMLSCFIARKMGAKHTVARIRNTEYNTSNLSFIKHQLELSMVINPELLAAELIYNILKLPTAINVETFARRKLEMAELIVKQGSALDGAKL